MPSFPWMDLRTPSRPARPAAVIPPFDDRVVAAVPDSPLPADEPTAELQEYMIVGAWSYDSDAHVYLDAIDRNAYGMVELSGGRCAEVGGSIRMTRDEARVVGKRFAVAPVLSAA